MAIKVYGVPDTIDALQWAQLFAAQGQARTDNAVLSGLAVTISGTNLVVSAGKSLQAGTLAVSDTSVTIPVPKNTATSSRMNVLALQVDWSGTVDTAGSFVIIPGTSMSVPAWTQTEGVLWQTQLFRFTLAANSSTPTNLVDITPEPAEKTCSGSVTLSDGGTDPKTVAITFPARYFSTTPRVTLSPTSAIANGVTQSWAAQSKTKDGFTAQINKSSTGSTTFDWVASGY